MDARADGLNPFNLHIYDRLSFFSLTLCPFLTPAIKFFVPFNQHGHQRVMWYPFGELWMLPDITVKFRDQLGILLFKNIHGAAFVRVHRDE